MTKTRFASFACVIYLIFAAAVFAQPDLAKIYKDSKSVTGKRPIIVIPGILGSELKNAETGETVWFSVSKVGNEDLRLPVALNLERSRDKLIPGDIIREIDFKIFPDVDVYQGLINSLTKYGGYEEASWEDPPENLEDKFFVFPYDWRRDNVETARYLIEEIEEVKRLTGRRDVKFNILAHSMGGLIARYAAMFGKADLPDGLPKPTWAGEKHFANIFLFGTPNEGSAEALETLFLGQSSLGGTVNLPFVRFLSPVDIATMPAVFQLMPHGHTTRFFDENLEPIKIDLYNGQNWKKYGWAIYSKKKYMEEFSDAETERFEQYFDLVLKRAKKFHRALDARTARRSSMGVYLIGSDCRPTLDAMVVYKDEKDRWITLTKPDKFETLKGEKITSERLKPLMLAPGDGSVTRRSLLAETLEATQKKSVLFDSDSKLTSTLFVCEGHTQIMNNPSIQNNVLSVLISEGNRNRAGVVKP